MIATELLHRVSKVALLKHIASPVDENELVCIADLRNEYEIDDATPTRIVPVPDFPTESCINGQSGAYATA